VTAEFSPAQKQDNLWMQRALEQARAALTQDEVPIGAVLVHDERLLAEAYNLTRTWSDPTAHAESVAIRRAAEKLGGWRVLDATLYVTLEPCAMCAGAIVLARVRRLVFGAFDPKAGMCGSLACIVQDDRLNHRVQLTNGVLAEPAGDLLRSFFRARR
jgi:tRNA(adenine34) deaminase